ncbi:MAG: biotin/lipoyl-binding protein [Gemmatimonadota bacterium]|jgi:pyruvate carboxylase subunit B|nr:MAG: biotin/lipoyl-binding protein [Gemmatimonadota bacterium]
MRYFVEASGEVLQVEATETGVRIGKREFEAHIESVPGSDRRHLRIGERGIALAARSVGDGWLIEIAGRPVRLAVEDERTHTIRELAPAQRGAGSREVRAPMAGLVLHIEVVAGQQVEAGTGLVVIEAMKMENELRAEGSGTVATIAVKEGSTVNPGDLLLTFSGEGP